MNGALDSILAGLPHGLSFRFLSAVHELAPGEAVTASWRVDGSEPFLSAHFPGDPIVPGVLLTEALAQAAGLVAGDRFGDAGALLCHIDVRLHEPVRPPAVIVLKARLIKDLGGLFLFDVEAAVEGSIAAGGRLTLAARRRAAAGATAREEEASS